MNTKLILYVRKIWRGKIFANLVNGVQFAKIFLANSYKYSEITKDLPADSPKFSLPFASSVMIHQNFLPPKFPTYSTQECHHGQVIDSIN